jgi:four helix bundle protein
MDVGKFDFERLIVFQKAQEFYRLVRTIRFSSTHEDRIVARQFLRAALSVPLNIAEGSGRTSLRDRRNFLVIARGSSFECAAIILTLERESRSQNWKYQEHYNSVLEVTKMLSTMIVNLDKKIPS